MLSIPRLLRFFCAAALFCAGSLGAQQLAAARIGLSLPSHELARSESVAALPVARSARQIKRWPYVATGAVIGSVVGGGLMISRIAREDDAMGGGIFVVGAAAAGAGLGALAGLIVSVIAQPGDY
jgi:hypothetical protein